MQKQDVLKLLDEVLGQLEQAGQGRQVDASSPAGPVTRMTAVPPADAIDREIGGPARQTAVASLRNSEAARRFRQELESESLTLATVTGLLQLVQQALRFFRLVAG